MKRVLFVLGAALLLATVSGAGVATAGDENGCEPSEVLYQGSCQPGSTPITICHVAGLASDPANYVTLNITLAAAIGFPSGHLNENGTPLAGHEQDTLGECNPPPPPPVDVCPNLEGNQAEVPPGYHLGEDENGRPACIKDENPPPVELAVGVSFTEATCTTPPGFVFVKTNIPGVGLRPFYNVEGPEFVDGHPVAGGTYTVTAVPVPGYTFVGQTEFTHTFAAAPTNCGGVTLPNGSASVICLLPAGVYQLSGVVDGQAADSVTPATLPGTTKGVVNVVVTRGDTSVRTTVSVNGDCTNPGTTTTATPVTPAAAPAVTAPTTPATPAKPVAKPKPKAKPKKRATTTKKKVVKKPKPNKKPQKAPKTLGLS